MKNAPPNQVSDSVDEGIEEVRISLGSGIYVIARSRAGNDWITAWHVLTTALKRCGQVKKLRSEE